MRNFIYCTLILLFTATPWHIHAQAFSKHKVYLSAGVGFNTNFEVLTTGESLFEQRVYSARFTTPLPQFNFKSEFALGSYWSIGILGSVSGGTYYNYHSPNSGTALQVGAGLFTNFHFYQLIADVAGNRAKLHADKWDIYIGTGLGDRYYYYKEAGQAGVSTHSMYYDFHAGVKYNINDRVAIFGELGNGQSTLSIGAVFNIGIKRTPKPIKQF